MLSLCDLLENATDLVVKHDLTNDNRLKKVKFINGTKNYKPQLLKKTTQGIPFFFSPLVMHLKLKDAQKNI